MREMFFTTEAYKKAAVSVMIDAANQACRALQLPEILPITPSSLTESEIETPFFSDHQKRFGTICTDNYVYGADVDNKLSYINRNFRDGGQAKFLSSIKNEYSLPKSELNLKEAHLQAVHWLAAFSVDVNALDKDFHIEVEPWDLGNRFVPLYTVHWYNGEKEVATVELFEPEHLLLKLWVREGKYLKGNSLVVPNREKLLACAGEPVRAVRRSQRRF
jgi:hypothetical protein